MFLKYFCALILTLNSKLINGEGVCGDGWDLFHDDYYDICYKYFTQGLADFETVVTACRGELDSTLPTINSREEQDFLNKLIVKYKMVENLYLDASIKNKHIVWTDSSSGEYENWLTGHPINESNCVEMVPEQGNLGKWQDVPCTKKNAYICKRVVMWSGQRTERLIRDNRRLLDETLAEITKLKQSQVPIGFIYVQLPDQSDPNTLWPGYKWSDVTASYAGQFFRAEGGGSLAFGKGAQAENAPRLTKISFVGGTTNPQPWDIEITPGEWSNLIVTGGGDDVGGWVSTRYLMSGGEVRPQNQAVRVFKRIM